MYSKYPEVVRTCILRAKRYNQTMEYIDKLEEKGDIFVLRPQMKPVSRLEKDQDKLAAFYEHGYTLMREMLPDMLEYLGEEMEDGDRKDDE